METQIDNITARINFQVPPQKKSILAYYLAGETVFIYSDSDLWVRLESFREMLGPIELTYLLSNELKLLTEDKEAGTYCHFDDFLAICPAHVRIGLIARRKELLATAEGMK